MQGLGGQKLIMGGHEGQVQCTLHSLLHQYISKGDTPLCCCVVRCHCGTTTSVVVCCIVGCGR